MLLLKLTKCGRSVAKTHRNRTEEEDMLWKQPTMTIVRKYKIAFG